jgi:hypothetical protein
MGVVGQALGHEGDHGPQDHGFVAGGQVLVVADGAAVFADPGEGPLDDPAAGQDLEGVRVAFADDFQGHVENLGPGGEFPDVSGVGPDQADAAAGAVQVPQQRPGALAVLDGRGGDHHVQYQAGYLDGDVALAAVDLLGVIPAPAGSGNGIGSADRLGIDDRGRGLGVAPGGGPGPGAQLAVQPGQGAVIALGGEVAVDGLPRREVRGQVPPGAPGPVHIQDGLDDPPRRPDPGPPRRPGPLRRQMRGDDLPLSIGQVAGIAPGPPSGPARTLGTRGPSCLPGRHTSGSWGPRLASARHDTPRSPPDSHQQDKPPNNQTLTQLSGVPLVMADSGGTRKPRKFTYLCTLRSGSERTDLPPTARVQAAGPRLGYLPSGVARAVSPYRRDSRAGASGGRSWRRVQIAQN